MNRERQVYVGRLTSKVKREDLQEEFERFGKIKDIELKRNHAFIEFEEKDEASKAIVDMDGRKVRGERIACKTRGS